MGNDEIEDYLGNGHADRMLRGTDMCFPQYFYSKQDMAGYYKTKLDAFRRIFSSEQYNRVTCRNAVRLFRIFLNKSVAITILLLLYCLC